MALTTLNLSGIKAGDSLNISVSQGGLTAGPYSVGSWGGGGDGGTIAINVVHRSIRQMAPDSVRFEVDLSSATFDTPGPSGTATFYDPRMHELIYLWDFGDPGTWTAPEKGLPAWKNRNTAMGPGVRHLYREPDDYTVSVLVIEPSSGKTATASTTVSVSDPQDYYGDANTIYVNNVGDNDWSYVPVGVPSANKVNIDSLQKYHDGSTFIIDATWAAFDGGHAKRWRFKRGGDWDVSVYLSFDDKPHIMFDDYGDPAEQKPLFRPVDTTTLDPSLRECIKVGYSHDLADGLDPNTNPPEVRIRNIRAEGGFDAVTTDGANNNRTTFLRGNGALSLTMADCDFNGFGNSTIYNQTSSFTKQQLLHMDNCTLNNFGGQYPIMWVGSYASKTSVALSGLRAANPGDARCGAGNVGAHSILRGDGMFTHIQGCDIFSTDETQPGLSPVKTPRTDGFFVNIHSNAIEGGSTGMSMGGNYSVTPEQRCATGNIIVDGLIYVGTWESKTAVSSNASGMTVRNVLGIWAQVPRLANACTGLIEFEIRDQVRPDVVMDAPVKIYNSTLVMERTMEQQSSGNSFVPTLFSREKYTPEVPLTDDNNILHFPNLIAFPNTTEVNAEHIVFAPLTEVALWTPRCLGRRDPTTGVLDTQYALPATTVKDSKPTGASIALVANGGATTGEKSFTDITGGSRYGAGVYDEGTIDKGPWQVS